MSVRRPSGFTVFELMIVLAIAALAAAFAIPGFQELMARNRLKAWAEELTNSIVFARNTAITTRRPVFLVVNGSGWEIRMDAVGGTVVQQHQVAEQTVQFTTVPADMTSIQFQPTGFVQFQPTNATALSIELCDSAHDREIGRDIVLSRIGRTLVRQHANAAACNS